MSLSLKSSCVDCPSRKYGPLADLPEALLMELSSIGISQVYKKGQVVFFEGSMPHGVYHIKSGKVKLTKFAPEGKGYISRISKHGDLLGYRSFLTNELYSATAEVLEDATICFIYKDRFFEIMQKYPQLSFKLIELLGKELKCSENNSRDIAYKSTQERIVELLLTLKEGFGIEQEDNSYKLEINLTREDLASMIGTTLETTVRLTSWLKEKGLLDTKQRRMYITDVEGLKKLVPQYSFN